jgi:hypothetical protein
MVSVHIIRRHRIIVSINPTGVISYLHNRKNGVLLPEEFLFS